MNTTWWMVTLLGLGSCGGRAESPPDLEDSRPASSTAEIPEVYRTAIHGFAEDEERDALWEAMPYDRISMTSSGCYGTCPVFTVSFERGGRVTWGGGRYVDTFVAASDLVDELEQPRTGRCGLQAYARMCMVIERFGFESLEPAYLAPWTDDNEVVVTVTPKQGVAVAVRDYGSWGPPELYAIQLAIEAGIGDVDWER